MRTEAGVLLVASLVALAGCGGGGATRTVFVTTPSAASAAAQNSTKASSAGGAAAIADAAAGVASGVGDPVLAPAALAAVATAQAAAASGTGGTGGTSVTTPRTKTRKGPAPVVTRVITSSATGQYAVAHTNGAFTRPSQIVLKIDASPPQKGSVFWTIVCSEVGGGVGHEQAHATIQLPTSETLPIPAPSTYCIASGNVQLRGSGTVTLSFTG